MANIYEKVQNLKSDLLKANLKKSGENKFAGFKYYELADFLPTIIELCKENGIYTQISFTRDEAILKAINIEEPSEVIEITSPMEQLELKGCNRIQALGGTETYQRRYLYMALCDICENDMFDNTTEEITKEMAEEYTFQSGKHEGWTLKRVVEEDEGFLNWLLNNSSDKRLLDMIKLLTGKGAKTEAELDQHIELTKQFNDLLIKTSTDFEKLLKNYNKDNFNDLTDFEIEDAIGIMRKKMTKYE